MFALDPFVECYFRFIRKFESWCQQKLSKACWLSKGLSGIGSYVFLSLSEHITLSIVIFFKKFMQIFKVKIQVLLVLWELAKIPYNFGTFLNPMFSFELFKLYQIDIFWKTLTKFSIQILIQPFLLKF